MGGILNREDIERLLPHRDPFLFVGRVDELEEGKRIVAAYSFNPDSVIFDGHFPGNPVVPGVLLIEACAQAAGILAYRTMNMSPMESGSVLLKMDRVFFRRIVRPGEEITLEANVRHRRGPTWRCKVTASVGGEICADGEVMATLARKVESVT